VWVTRERRLVYERRSVPSAGPSTCGDPLRARLVHGRADRFSADEPTSADSLRGTPVVHERRTVRGASVEPVDASGALAELVEISAQIERAVVFDANGAVLGSTWADEADAQRLAEAAARALAAAAELHTSADVTRIEIEIPEGGFFVLREGERGIAATTVAKPTAGLVVYDLRACLGQIDPPKPKRRRVKAKEPAEDAAEGDA
jgi:predicted regulator of Ras-like GTPase activity (Roadblock/LC7/MglB family)